VKAMKAVEARTTREPMRQGRGDALPSTGAKLAHLREGDSSAYPLGAHGRGGWI
jgi:hypothetical protein